jgi:hypothetical protein
MAAPAPIPSLFSDVLGDAGHWDSYQPDHALLLATVGAAVATPGPQVSRAILNTASHSPTVLAFVLAGDAEHIHVGYAPSLYPQDLAVATPFDNQVVVLVGDDINLSVPIVLPDDAFTRIADTRVLELATIVGALGHLAAPPVFQAGPHGAGVANTAQIRVRTAFLLPAADSGRAVSTQPSGRYTLAGFHLGFVAPGLASADAGVVLAAEPLSDWFRAASTLTGPGVTPVDLDPIVSGAPVMMQRLNAWATRMRNSELAKLGAGGPALTTAAFNAGVLGITHTLSENTRETLRFQRDQSLKTFTQKHGIALATRMHRWCNVADDEHLPQIHTLLAKSSKHRDYAIVTSLIQERVSASTVPLTLSNCPLATTKLVDDVFRSLNPANTGLSFGCGLTPFAVVCEGHSEMESVRRLVKQAELAEAGSNISLADAERLTSSDVRFPVDAQSGAEKLWGWSILVDLFHGITHEIAMSVRRFVSSVGPALHRVAAQHADTPAIGMDHVCRVLYEAQQDYFVYVSALANGLAPLCPNFSRI